MNKFHTISDFDAVRRNHVGASDIPVIAGLYKKYDSSAVTLWAEKTGRAPAREVGAAAEWGHLHEHAIIYKFLQSRCGNEFAREAYIDRIKGDPFSVDLKTKTNLFHFTEFFHPEYTWAMCHPDLVYKSDGTFINVQAKSSGRFASKRRDDTDSGYDPDDLSANGIPLAVFLQIQWEMFCTGIDRTYVAALIDTSDYREYGPIMAAPRIQEKILAMAANFWRCVENDTPPPPTIARDMEIVFPTLDRTTRMLDGADLEYAREMQARYLRLSAREKQIKSEKQDLKNGFSVLSCGKEILADDHGNVLAEYKQYKGSTTIKGVEKIKQEHGGWFDILKSSGIIYTGEPERRLLVKKIK